MKLYMQADSGPGPEVVLADTGCWRSLDLESLFQTCFLASHNTCLRGGAPEPLYQPATSDEPARILYRDDYFRSALHEVAHWCVAGDARRQLPDYGYWYTPDGRDAAQQREFEKVEVLPQALELIFCAACRHPFSVSADNLEGTDDRSSAFDQAVQARARQLLKQGLPPRPAIWTLSLAKAYRNAHAIDLEWLLEVCPPPPHM